MIEQDRFDAALRQAARALVTEDLPGGVLDSSVGAAVGVSAGESAPGRGVRPRRALPGFAAAAAAVAILALATAVALAPGSPGGPRASAAPSPSPSPSPAATPGGTLRATAEIGADLATLDYTCKPGQPVASIGPEPDAVVREATVCTAPDKIGPLMAAVIVGESASGKVVEVHAKADIVGDDTATARDAIAKALAKISAISAAPPAAGNALGDWVDVTAPTLKPNGGANTLIRGFDIKLARNPTGGYLLIIHRAR